MEWHVPASVLAHASRLAAFVSGIFSAAIFISCAQVILPTLSLFGRGEPELGFLHASDVDELLQQRLALGRLRQHRGGGGGGRAGRVSTAVSAS